MKILAFAASSSRTSINKQLVSYAADILEVKHNADVEIIDLNDFEMPIYSADREKDSGVPSQAQDFYDKIGAAEAILISFAEHNASYTAAYKNLFDWTSRIDAKVYQNKPVVMLATSPGPSGAGNVLNSAKNSAPYFGIDLKASLSVAKFFDNFDTAKGIITDPDIDTELNSALSALYS